MEQKDSILIKKQIDETYKYLKSLQSSPDNAIILGDDSVLIRQVKNSLDTLKREYVFKNHVTKEGKMRTISEPTEKFGYFYTFTNDRKRVYGRTYDELIEKLYVYYAGDNSFGNLFKKACKEKALFKTNNTVLKYQADYKRFVTDDLAKKDIKDIDSKFIRMYTLELIKRIYPTIKTFRAYKSLLNLVYTYAIAEDIVVYNMTNVINNTDYYPLCKQSYKSNRDKAMSKEMVKELTQEIRERMKNPEKYSNYYVCGYMFLFSTLTGMRIGELCSIKWEDIKGDRLHIHTQQLKDQGTREYTLVPWTKNEKGIPKGGRYFPLYPELKDLVEEIREHQRMEGIESEFIFSNKDGNWIHGDIQYEKFLQRLCKKFNYEITNNHSIRMYFNSYVLITKGITENNRAALLGHSVEVNLRHYTFADYECCDIAMEMLSKDYGYNNPANVIPFNQFENLKNVL